MTRPALLENIYKIFAGLVWVGKHFVKSFLIQTFYPATCFPPFMGAIPNGAGAADAAQERTHRRITKIICGCFFDIHRCPQFSLTKSTGCGHPQFCGLVVKISFRNCGDGPTVLWVLASFYCRGQIHNIG